MVTVHIVERAYQLAGTGRYKIRSDIARALGGEGYTQTDLQHLQGVAITRDLNRLCKAAQRPSGPVRTGLAQTG